MDPSILGSDTLASRLSWWAQLQPDEKWLVYEREPGATETTTYAQAAGRAAAAASVLAEHGVETGDRFHVHLTNCPEFYDMWFAASLMGSVMVPTNPLLTKDEISYVVEHARTTCSVTQPDLLDAVSSAVARSAVLVTGTELGNGLPPEPWRVGDGCWSL